MPYVYFTGCGNRGAFQDLFSNIWKYLSFVLLDGFIVKARKDSLFSKSCLDQHPVVLDFRDVLHNDCSDTVEETHEWRL